MPFLIDGHNLIPKLGLRLDSIDDELELISILQEYSRFERKKQVEVYFDGAPSHHAGSQKLGAVTAHFVPLGTTADDAIRKRLTRMGKSARNWTVISSDRQVQIDAKSARSAVLSSEEFAKKLKQVRNAAPKPANDRNLSKQEVDDWLRIFNEGKSK
jgi:predicted RNA-binding protein with PIN domain